MSQKFESEVIKNQMENYIASGGNTLAPEYIDMQQRLEDALKKENDLAHSNPNLYNQQLLNQRKNDSLDNPNRNNEISNKKLNDKLNSDDGRVRNLMGLPSKKEKKEEPKGKGIQTSNQELLNKFNNPKNNSDLKKRLASRALNSVGVPKPATDRLVDASNKKVKDPNGKGLIGGLGAGILGENQQRETKDAASDGGAESFKVTLKFLKTALIVFIPVFCIIIFMNLIVSSSSLIRTVVGLEFSNDLLDSKANDTLKEKINENNDIDEDIEEEFEDDNDLSIASYTLNSFALSKLNNYSLILANVDGMNNKEITLDDLEDFYPGVTSLSKNYDSNMVYYFFLKMYNLYYTYYNEYKVQIDLPLLMSTLIIQSDDMNEIFKSNLRSSDRKDNGREEYEEFKYDYSWEGYNTTKNNGPDDMALLVHNMVSRVDNSECSQNNLATDGNCYKIDRDKYREYLPEFINQKYYNSSKELSDSQIFSKIIQIYEMRQQYIDFVGDYEEETIVIHQSTSDSYWWPIGSSETTVVNGKTFATGTPETVTITSNFDYRVDPFGRGSIDFHSGLDIAGGSGLNSVNIIAARDGIVVYPTADVSNDCPSSNVLSLCGGGYGNHVIIQHSDGNYTLYAHMYEGSITVKAGDSVQQGQVIGKMGSSGQSTGPHLHFEVRIGNNMQSAAVNPLDYISAESPRVVLSNSDGGEFAKWLYNLEGSTPIDGDYYIVKDIGDGVRSVGSGVTLEYNIDLFAAHGINVDDYPIDSRLPIELVDQIKLEIISRDRDEIKMLLSNSSLKLEEYQIDALLSQQYNIGDVFANWDSFVSAYKKYGNTQEFYENWFFRKVMKGTQFEAGLTKRRQAEWILFHTGEYVYDVY